MTESRRRRRVDLIQPFTKALHALVRPDELLLVAVSGGTDSLALLDLVARVHARLVVVHLDHGWRAGSDEDARFVREEATRRGLELVAERAEATSVSEAAGREARLAFFARVARERGAQGVLLGHTADDQAETVLLRLLRGAGIAGLGAMRAETDVEGLHLLRPLLGFTRTQLVAYCAARGLAPREDPTNRDPRFLRNRVRHELLPLAEQIAPGGAAALVRLAETVADDAELIAALAARSWDDLVLTEPPVGLDRAGFRRQPVALQRALLRRAGALLEVPDLTYERIEAARVLALRGRGGAVVQWPAGWRVVNSRGRVSFEREAEG